MSRKAFWAEKKKSFKNLTELNPFGARLLSPSNRASKFIGREFTEISCSSFSQKIKSDSTWERRWPKGNERRERNLGTCVLFIEF